MKPNSAMCVMERDEYEFLQAMIGQLVAIQWRDRSIWPFFRLLKLSPLSGGIKLLPISESGEACCCTGFWSDWDEVVDIALAKGVSPAPNDAELEAADPFRCGGGDA